MSHLHRMRAAQQAIAADEETCHTCKPTLPANPADSEPATDRSSAAKKRAPAKKKATRRR